MTAVTIGLVMVVEGWGSDSFRRHPPALRPAVGARPPEPLGLADVDVHRFEGEINRLVVEH